MVSTLPEYYVRVATSEDTKYASDAAKVFTTAYSGTKGSWTSTSKVVNNYYFTKENMEDLIQKSLQGQVVQMFAFKRDAEGRDERVVGTLTLEKPCPNQDGSMPKKEGMLGKFSVDPSLQSKGLGRLLIDFGLNVMKSQDYVCCSILVFENRHDILKWYTKLGFVDTQRRVPFNVPHFASLVADPIDFALLKKEL